MERPRTITANASFSPYLKHAENHLNQTDHTDDTEISIFDARKYYFSDTNLKPNDSSVLSRISSASSGDGYSRHLRGRSFNAAATPTASSEASWNSQTGLLSNPPGAARVKINPPGTPSISDDLNEKGSRKKWLFGRKCPCSGDKSVQVESNTKAPQESFSNTRNSVSSNGSILKTVSLDRRASTSPRSSWGVISGNTRRISAENQFSDQSLVVAPPVTTRVPLKEPGTGFTFPILENPQPKPLSRLPPLKLALTAMNNLSSAAEEPPRDSLEVFRPKDEYVVVPTKSSEEGASQQQNSRQSFTFPGSPNLRMGIAEEDVGSDASSDLFEIESFSTQATTTTCSNYPLYPRRDSLDEAVVYNKYSPAMEGYEPSEASVEWSVTTAEGFAPASVAASEMAEEATGDRGGRRRAAGNGLLSCRCEKAVSVGPRPQPVAKEKESAPQAPPPTSTVRHVSYVHKPPLR